MSDAGDDQLDGRTYDVAVVGAGPAGRAIAARAAVAGVDVALVDPAPHRIWHVTYGSWADELPTWVESNTVATQCDSITVFTPDRHTIDRGYVTFDTPALQRSLRISGVTVVSQTAITVGIDAIGLRDGRVVTARTVIDARGLRGRAAPSQSAFGVFLDNALAAQYLGPDTAVLMDWRGVRPIEAPSFLYAIPVAGGRTLLEETCLAGAPAVPVAELRERLLRRLSDAGMARTDVDGAPTERVHFALRDPDGVLPPWRAAPLRFGAAGGLMHPATGYSLAASLSAADAVVDAIAHNRDPRAVLWPARARAVYRLRCRGLASLLGLSPVEVVRFFDGFFAMPPEHQRTYLSARDDLTGVAAAMTRMLALTDRALALRIMRGAVSRHG